MKGKLTLSDDRSLNKETTDEKIIVVNLTDRVGLYAINYNIIRDSQKLFRKIKSI